MRRLRLTEVVVGFTLVMLVACLPPRSLGLHGNTGEFFDGSLVGFRPYSTTVTLYPIADSWVDKKAPDANKGTDAKLHSRGPADDQRISFLKFDLSSLGSGINVVSAQFYLRRNGGDTADQTADVYFVSADSWGESTITWNNMPGMSSLVASLTVGGGDWYYWGVGSAVQTELSGDKILSLAVTMRVAGDHKDWDSRESANPPYIVVTVSSLDHFSVYATPSTVQVGQSFSVIVTAKDSSNNTITSWTGPVSLSAVLASNPSTPGGGILGITSTTITSGGTVTVTGETYTKVETIKIKATSGSITGLSNPVNFIAGSAYKIEYVSGSGQSQAAMTTLTNPFVARVTDQYGNPVSGRTVTWAITSFPAGATGQSLSVTSGPTDASGLASSTLTLGTKVGAYQATASSSGLVGSPVTFNATASTGALHHFHVYAFPSIVQAGQHFSVTIIAKDAGNNTITDWTGPLTLSTVLASDNSTPGGGILGVTSTAITSGGTVTITDQTYTKVETIRIKATSGAVTGISNPVTIIAGDAYRLVYVSGNGQSQTVVTTLVNPFVAKVTDFYGNPVSGRTVAWSIVSYPAGATGQSLSITSGPSDANGLASSTLTLGTKTGAYQASASSAGLVGSPVLFNATATPGALHLIIVTPNPATVVAGHTQPFVATSYDLYNNVIPGVTYIWTTDVGSINNAGLLTAQTFAPDTGYVRATNGTVHGDATVYVIPDVASKLFLIPESVNMTAGDQYSWFTVQTRDQYDNVAPVTSNLIVQLAVNSPTGKFRPVGGATNITQVTILAGQNSTKFDYFDVTVGLYTVTVSATGLLPDTSTVRVNVAPSQQFVFAYISSPQIAGVPFSITIYAKDGLGNIITSYTGRATLTDLTGTITPTLTGNFVAGVWTGNVTITKAQTDITITATSPFPAVLPPDGSTFGRGILGVASITMPSGASVPMADGVITGTSNPFDVIHGEAKHLTVTPDPATVESGDSQVYTAMADDGFGNFWNVTSSTVFSIVQAGHGGSWAGRVYTSYGLGTWTVRGSYAALTDDATLNVIGGLLNVVKSGPGVVQPGQTFSYTIVIQNNGAGMATDIFAIDQLPIQVIYISSGPPGAYFPANHTVRWDLPNVAPGASLTISVTVQVLSSAPDSTMVQTASVDWSQRKQAYGPDPPTSTVTTNVRSAAMQFQFTKTANATYVIPGDTVAFTISLTNTSPFNSTPVENVMVTDLLPPLLQLLSSSPAATVTVGAGGVTILTWTLASLAPGATYTVTYRVQIGQVSDRTYVHNTATFSAYSHGGSDHYTGTQMVTLTIDVSELVITKTSSVTSASPGDTVPFTITVVNNNAQLFAYNVVVEEHIPAEMTFISASGPYSYDQASGKVTWTISQLNPSQSVSFDVSLRIRTTVVRGTTITDEASVQWKDRNLNNYGPIYAYCTITVKGPADLLIKKTANPSNGVRPGSLVTFSLEVTNIGEAIAKNIIVTDALPAGLTYQAGSSYLLLPDGTNTSITPTVFANGSISWTVSTDLFPSTKFVITFVARVSETAKGPMYNIGMANSTDDKILVPIIIPSFVATKVSDVNQAERGARIVYTVHISNVGNDTATTITIQDHLSPSLQYIVGSSTLGGQPIADPRQEGGTLTWNLSVTLPPGQGLTMTFSALVVPQATGPIPNSIIIVYDHNSTDTPSDPVSILVPALTASKVADKDTAAVGDNVTFTITFTNVGNGTAYGVTVTDMLPANLDYIAGTSTLNGSSFPDPDVQPGPNLVWNVTDALHPGQTLVLSFKIVVRSLGPTSTAENVARIDWTDGGGGEDHVYTQEVTLGLRQIVTSLIALLLAAGPVMMLVGRRSKIVLSDMPLEFLLSTDMIGHLKELYNEIWVAPIVVSTTTRRLSPNNADDLNKLIQDRTILVSTKEETVEAPQLSNEDANSLVVAAELGGELCPTSEEALAAATDLGITTKEVAVLVGQMYLRRLITEATLQELTTRLYEARERRQSRPVP